MMTRDEHLAWCKRRAHEYLDEGDVQGAIMSMMGDLRRHPHTASINPHIEMFGVLAAKNNDVDQARRFIDGFN
jgi:hypothetical protein